MDFQLTDEQELLRKTVREFAEKVLKPKRFELDRKEEFSIELTKKMGEMGFLGAVRDLCTLSYVIIIEELARVDACHAATVAAHNSLGVGPILHFGSEVQKKKWLPDLCEGKKLWSFGLTEPDAGSDAGNSKTTAVLKNGEWVINGSKIFITNGASSMTAGCTVQCVTSGQQSAVSSQKKELSCILVPQGTDGFTAKEMHNKMVWRSSNTAELYFNNVK